MEKNKELNNMEKETMIMKTQAILNIVKAIKQIKEKATCTNKAKYENSIKKLENDIEKIKRLKKSSYEDWKLEKISREEFINYAKDYELRIENFNNEINIYKNKLETSLKDIKEEEYWIDHFRKNKKVKSLTREIIEDLIDTIYVQEGGNITIKFRYEDEYKRILDSIKNEMEVEK